MKRLIIDASTGDTREADLNDAEIAAFVADQQAQTQMSAARAAQARLDDIDAQIAALEAKQARPLREAELARGAGDHAALAAAQARIKEIDDLIAGLRAARIAGG